MKFTSLLTTMAASLLLLQGCGEDSALEEKSLAQTENTSNDNNQEVLQTEDGPNIVQIRAVGLTLEGPSEIPSGWTTFRFENTSDMIHLVMIDVPPKGVDAKRMATELVLPYQNYMDALNADNHEAAKAVLETFPAWNVDLHFMDGPGFLSAHMTSGATVFLEPGFYILECYVKTGGVWHTYNPDPDALGMVLELQVTDEKSGGKEPTANLSLDISNTGYEVTSGAMTAGHNVVKVTFVEQQVHENFLGNDVHIVRMESEADMKNAVVWLDWRGKSGLETPTPVTFYGGLNDMPVGATGYFSVDLEPGNYAFIAEVPTANEKGFVLSFAIE